MVVRSNDTDLSQLLYMVGCGKIQLPDFQRSWVWDNEKICKLIESIASGYPMGAAMFLETGGSQVRFTYRKFTGVTESNLCSPDYLVLDGQQRLTTLFQVFHSQNAVQTCSQANKGKELKRFYYLDIRKALDPNADMLDAVISIDESKILTEDIGRNIKLDLSTTEKEYESLMFPLNLAFSSSEIRRWERGLARHYDETILDLFDQFDEDILANISSYKIPVITIGKEASRDAVCQIFENVNTGGVKLTVFELITATFAADEYNLRDDWDSIINKFKTSKQSDVLRVVENTTFLTAMTLLVNYRKSKHSNVAVSCKKKDVLRLELTEYKENREALVSGFFKAANFLIKEFSPLKTYHIHHNWYHYRQSLLMRRLRVSIWLSRQIRTSLRIGIGVEYLVSSMAVQTKRDMLLTLLAYLTNYEVVKFLTP